MPWCQEARQAGGADFTSISRRMSLIAAIQDKLDARQSDEDKKAGRAYRIVGTVNPDGTVDFNGAKHDCIHGYRLFEVSKELVKIKKQRELQRQAHIRLRREIIKHQRFIVLLLVLLTSEQDKNELRNLKN